MPHYKWSERIEREVPLINGPIREVFIGHTFYSSQLPCYTFEDCKNDVRKIDRAMWEYPQIVYNFLIGGYEEAFYGRGFEKKGAIRGCKLY